LKEIAPLPDEALFWVYGEISDFPIDGDFSIAGILMMRAQQVRHFVGILTLLFFPYNELVRKTMNSGELYGRAK